MIGACAVFVIFLGRGTIECSKVWIGTLVRFHVLQAFGYGGLFAIFL